ncbi:hypothetical protein KGF54_001587 [Candida jiufengensis]|uniref:uncharacterized protein n=1 Tax=Candida jiufengensis TaxID=497108 RepID=UPI00222490F7|nr:uncharacterized protein KGF54_001587 [Candida jiufengensis]KAI5955026.1 hypothetical protein KGF54_001587 [Candida jiufengensis]
MMPPKKQKLQNGLPSRTNQEDQTQTTELLTYLKSKYRPYSLTDIQLNLHGKFKKTQLTTILESLLSEKEVIVKTIGKTNYYCYKEIIASDNASIDELNDKIKKTEEELSGFVAKVCEITQKPTLTNEMLKRTIEETQQKAQTLRDQVAIAEQKSKNESGSETTMNYVSNLIKLKEKQQKIVCYLPK